MDVCAVIMVAGKGTRMQSKYHKGTHKICGKEMVNIIIDKLKRCGINEINLIVGENRESIIDITQCKNVSYSIQEEQLGTGHAVLCAQEFLEDKTGDVLVFACDMPLFDEENIVKLINTHKNENNSSTVVTSFLDDALSYGRIIRTNGDISCVREAKDCNQEELLINEINTSIYCFKVKDLLDSVKKVKNSNSQNEFYLTDVIEILSNEDKKIGSISVPHEEVIGVDSRIQLYKANECLRKKINEYHMKNGVTILDPKSTYIDMDVKIGKDVMIHPNVYICGNSVLHDDCEILPNTRIVNSVISSGVRVENSSLYDSEVGENSSIGPYAYLRPNSVIGKNVKIGDFVEIKNSTIGDNTKVSHLSYVGDSLVGKNCNLGCGIVTVNYNGNEKNKTIIGDNCFVGCNVNLIAPVVVNDNSYVAAGTTVTENVDSNSLAIGRCRQTNKKDWVVRKYNS